MTFAYSIGIAAATFCTVFVLVYGAATLAEKIRNRRNRHGSHG